MVLCFNTKSNKMEICLLFYWLRKKKLKSICLFDTSTSLYTYFVITWRAHLCLFLVYNTTNYIIKRHVNRDWLPLQTRTNQGSQNFVNSSWTNIDFSNFFQILPILLIFLQIRIENDLFSRVNKFGFGDRAENFEIFDF